MIKHVVLFRLKDSTEEATKKENLKIFQELLSALPKKIKEIRQLEFGNNISVSPNASDICLISSFDNEHGLDVYRNHPEYKKVVEFILKVSEESRVVDFENE